jgi:hypothetical protein
LTLISIGVHHLAPVKRASSYSSSRVLLTLSLVLEVFCQPKPIIKQPSLQQTLRTRNNTRLSFQACCQLFLIIPNALHIR